MHKTILPILGILFFSGFNLQAEKIAVKTNLLTDALLNPNIGIETDISRKLTIELDGELNAWDINGHKWKHWLVSPELRLWYCEKFQGSFWGLHLLGGEYNFGNIKNNIHFLGSDFQKLTDYRFQGWGVGAGIGYGYAWILSKHLNLEFEIGLGWIYTRYTQYPCELCGAAVKRHHPHNYVGPTKLSLALEYIF